jgi:hypothetical protein
MLRDNKQENACSGPPYKHLESTKLYLEICFSVNDRLLVSCTVEEFDYDRIKNSLHCLSCGTLRLSLGKLSCQIKTRHLLGSKNRKQQHGN